MFTVVSRPTPRRGRRFVLAALCAATGALLVPAGASAISGSVAFSGIDPRPSVPTGLTARVDVDAVAGNPGASQLRRLQVTLPQGLELGTHMSTGGGGLQFCSAGAFAVHGTLPSSCPATTAIGAATVVAPSIPTPGPARPLRGEVYLGAPPSPGDLPSLYLEAALDGSRLPGDPRFKMAATLSVDADHRLSAVFDEVPSPPFSSLQFTLAGGDRAILGTPAACGTYAGFATLTSAATADTHASAAPITIDQDCATPPFAPSIGLASSTSQAGAAATSAFSVSREDRSPRLGIVRFALPPGLLADIGSVPECALTDSAAAGCPPDSRIASVEAVAGLGPNPRRWTGAVYVTPRQPGAVAGAHLVLRASTGDLDLGDLVVAARIDLRPTDAGLDVTFPVPTRFRGVGLNVRSVAVAVDRGAFAVNPTSCGPLGFSAVLTSEHGQTVGRDGAIGYTGCGALPFAPTLQATLTGETGPLGHPNVSVALSARPGDSNLRGATVTLPRGIAADLTNVQNACPREMFEAVACSAAQRVGTATARIAFTPEPIPGDVYLVRLAGESLPGLGMSFTGRFAQRVLSRVTVDAEKRLVTRFETIPDFPLRRLDMDIFGGKNGPIRVAAGNCQVGSVWDASFAGHGGQVSSHTIPAPCAPRSAKRSAVTLSSVSGLTWRISDLGGRTLQSAKLTLPTGFLFVRARARLRQYQVVRLAGSTAKVTVTSRAVILAPRTKTARSLQLKLKPGSVGRTTRVSRKSPLKRVKVKVRLGFTDGTVQNQTITIRAR